MRGGPGMPLLVVGTRNPKKRLELLEILGGTGIELRDLTAYPDAPEVVEDGQTFADNARKKAVELARHLKQWTLGEDSGLVVPGLGGRPRGSPAPPPRQQGDAAPHNTPPPAPPRPPPPARPAPAHPWPPAPAAPRRPG